MLKRLYKWWTGEEMHRHVFGPWRTLNPPLWQVRTCAVCGFERHRQIPMEW